MEKMERLAERSRFAEGEQYAQKGRVPAIRFDGRTIAARVQGPQEPSVYCADLLRSLLA